MQRLADACVPVYGPLMEATGWNRCSGRKRT